MNRFSFRRAVVLAALVLSGCAADVVAVQVDLGVPSVFLFADSFTITSHAPREDLPNDADACDELERELRSASGFTVEPTGRFGATPACEFFGGAVLESLPTEKSHLVLAVRDGEDQLLAYACETVEFGTALPETITFVTDQTPAFRAIEGDPPFATAQERCASE